MRRGPRLDDAEPERRGINSIQLFRDPDRGWRIMAMIWDNEREGVTIPEWGQSLSCAGDLRSDRAAESDCPPVSA